VLFRSLYFCEAFMLTQYYYRSFLEKSSETTFLCVFVKKYFRHEK